jgi:hypothetical protein
MAFPPLYQCSQCGQSVRVVPQGEGIEPVIVRKCGHDDAVVWANRKVTLRGVGAMENMGAAQRTAIKVTLTLRQLLSALTGRSV